MTDSFFRRDDCRLCGSRDLQLALPMEATPLGDDFLPAGQGPRAQPVYPLELWLCPKCGNVQLGHVVNPELVYREYRYTSSVSLGLTDHFLAYADALLERTKVGAGALVVELGSNEGAMLRAFQRRGLRTLGVDPAREIAARATAAGIETLPTYFTAEMAGGLRRERGPASLVIANNVFANIDDLHDVVRGVRALLAADGVFVVETSYCLDVVEKALIDTIFHEHLTYFAAAPLAAFFAGHGMELIDAERVETKGGSLRATAQLAGGPRPVAPAVGEMVRREAEAGLAQPETYRRLAARIARQKADLRGALAPLKAAGKVIAGYGASVGTTTMIYHFGLGDYFSFLADDDAGKFDTLSPGLHLPTCSSQALYDRRADYAVILAWRYAGPILKRHAAFLAGGGRFILPHPEVKVL